MLEQGTPTWLAKPLATLLRSMSPTTQCRRVRVLHLHDGQWLAGLEIIGSFREQEGLTVILEPFPRRTGGLQFRLRRGLDHPERTRPSKLSV
jgi:hypothetical protein